MYGGTAAVVLGLGKFHAQNIGDYDFTESSRFGWALAYIALLAVAAFAVGLPDVPRSNIQRVAAASGAVAAAALGISLLQLALGSLLLPRFVVLWSGITLIPWYGACHAVAARGRRRGEHRDRVVAVVGPDDIPRLVDDIARNPERPASLVWAESLTSARPARAGHQPLVDDVVDSAGTVLVLGREAQNDDLIVAQAAVLHERGVRVRTLSLFYDEWLGKLPAGELERMSLMFDIGEIHRTLYGRVKRVLDVATALAGLPVFLVAVPVVLAGNLVANRGSLLYTQLRVGKGGAEFRIRKFRTMRPDTGPSTWTATGDPRVTGFGRILRSTHVDELPQVLNILRGDLSVVGPRPEQPQYVAELAAKIPFYGLRHLVRPGLTGWAQVKYPYGASELDSLEKLQYEFYYLRHQGLALDLRIIGRTIRTVVGRGGT